MQRTEEIEVCRIRNIVNSVFLVPAIAYQDYSDFDSELKQYNSEHELFLAINTAIKNKAFSVNFSIYYPEAKGYFFSVIS